MTTQAQIMRKALEELATGIKHREVMVRIAKNSIAAADAAAEVDEKVDPADRYIKAQWAFEQIAKAKAEMKERCTQVAREKLLSCGHTSLAEKVEAAIMRQNTPTA